MSLTSTIQASDRVAQIVVDHPSCAKLLTEHKIDFCCHGEATLSDACAARGIDVEEFLARLRAAASEAAEEEALDVTRTSTAELVAHIVSRHHTYLRRTLPMLETLVARVAGVHGGHNPKLPELLDEFRELRGALEPHLDDEESVLFPLLMSRSPDPSELKSGLTGMREEHESVGRTLERMRALADDFSVPEWGCGSYRMMMSELAALEEDTLRHVHLENHVLMPRFDVAVKAT